MDVFARVVEALSAFLYTYILIVLLLGVGVYFTVRARFVQFRLLGESLRILREPKGKDRRSLSSFQALMVSTASRVGTGNIAGVSTAICLGGPGAVFWMWLTALAGSASAFIESTLAQIYKKRDKDGSSFGGPAYYIQDALRCRPLGVFFALALILTYMGGFNMVAAFNLAAAFENPEFFSGGFLSEPERQKLVIAVILAVLSGLCIFGGGHWLSKVTSVLVPVMAITYIIVSLVIIAAHITLIPAMFGAIFRGAFDFRAIAGGFTGSCVMYGIKRGLFSNEAGVGSAPNAAASASVSHPVKQGLVQMLSVYIDTIVICSATAFMLLCSGVAPSAEAAGMPFVQQAMMGTVGVFGVYFAAFALFCFAFTTLLGNYYYAEQNLKYLSGGTPPRPLLFVFRAVAVFVIYLGVQLEFDVAWNSADVMMGFMALINLPVICLLAKPALLCLADYTRQIKAGKPPVFKAANIGLERTDFWK